MPAIVVDQLQKSYGPLKAVDGISFEVEPGEVFGMLGPNGAGKTTTVEILEGLREADSGRVQVLGADPARESARVKQRIGVALQSATLMGNMTCREALSLFGSFYKRSVQPELLLERLGLSEKKAALVQNLSGGQQQRLCLALALVSDPDVVFLDEPTTGLDPQARRSLWEVIESMRAEGKTVILTTHYMEEAERLCDRVAILDHGKILAMDTPQALIRGNATQRAIEFTLVDGTLLDGLDTLPGAQKVACERMADGQNVVIYSDSVQKTLAALLEWAGAHNLELPDMRLRLPTLEDVFLQLTGRRIRD